MNEQITKAVFKILLDHADELEKQENPFEVVGNDSRFRNAPRDILRQAFIELASQDKISLLWMEEDIIAVFVNNQLAKQNGKTRPRMPGPNVVVFADVANVQHGRGLPPHVFPGNEINEQLTRAGYRVRERFALISTKGIDDGVITPFDLHNQEVMLRQQDFVPVPCPSISRKHPSPDDEMLMRLARSYFGNPDVETILVISGDQDYAMLKQEAEKMGHDFVVFTVSSNIGEDWLQQSRATMLDLSQGEKKVYEFLEQYLMAFKQNKTPKNLNEEETTALVLLNQAVQQIAKIQSHRQFAIFCERIWNNLPEVLRQIYTKDLLFRVVKLILSYTTIVSTRPYTSSSGKPGRGFAVRPDSPDLQRFMEAQ